MGSRRLNGVRFTAHPDDHAPPHVHARYGGTDAIIEIDDNGGVRLARRAKAVFPPDAKSSDIRRMLDVAAQHADVLRTLWKEMHP